MAKCNQLTSLSFKGLRSCGEFYHCTMDQSTDVTYRRLVELTASASFCLR